MADPLKEAVAPVAGAAKVTVTPLSRLLEASFTRTCKLVPNVELTVAACGVPAFAVILAGVPERFVKLKLALVVTPATLAITV
jgi:hypothetical protein